MDDYGSFRTPAPIVPTQDLEGTGDEQDNENSPLVSQTEQPDASNESEKDSELVVKIHAPEDVTEPTLEPIGVKLKRNAQKQYNRSYLLFCSSLHGHYLTKSRTRSL